MVRNTYDRFLDNGMRVLDLMSSWQSHLPQKTRLAQCIGVGLNEKELRKNTQLNGDVVQDLNQNPSLPFESDYFDVAVCTVSIEYLIHPLAVFNEIARVLKPDGQFVITFSNRWFPTKAIKIWKEIHEFERMGLVLEYFIRSGRFKDLQTYSIRGLPRPREDRNYPDLRFSDPVYAVWGRMI
jgi:SAM-dependent methyltransferase